MRLEGAHIAVTGGAGFIGSHLVDALIERGAHVLSIDDLSFGRLENVHRAADFVQADLTSADLQGALRNVDLVFHFAANATTKETQLGWNDPELDYRANGVGTLRLLQAMRSSNPQPALVMASSAAVYGRALEFPIRETHPTNPVSPYGVSKLAGEKYGFAYAGELGLRVAVLRIFNTYGPRQSRYVIYDLFKKLDQGGSRLELLGTGAEVRDYVFVRDTVEAALLVAEKDLWGEVFNVASGAPITVLELARAIVRELDKGETIEIIGSGQSWTGDIDRLEGDASKLLRAGYRPSYPLERGLALTLPSFREDAAVRAQA